MSVASPIYLKGFYDATRFVGDKTIVSDATLGNMGYKSICVTLEAAIRYDEDLAPFLVKCKGSARWVGAHPGELHCAVFCCLG